MFTKRAFPWLLVVFRGVSGCVLVAFAWHGHAAPWWWLGLMVLALFSDLFDGVLARRWNVVTSRLREADSWTDTFFCVCVAASVWAVHPEAVVKHAALLCVYLATDVLALATDWLKYRRFASYHAYSAKFAGLMLFLAVFVLQAFGSDMLVMPALLFAVLAHLERFAMTLLLPRWTPDVLHLGVALRVRREEPFSGT